VHEFDGKTIVLTGATGFLGRWFCDFFDFINENVLDNPCRIVAVDNNISGDASKLENSKINIVELDITKNLIALELLTGKVDYVINAAGIASPEVYQKYPFETLDVSYVGTHNILKFCNTKGVKSVLCFSSSEVYGTPDENNIPTREDYMGAVPTMSNRSSYDIGKKAIETICYIYHEKEQTPVKIVRPFNVYGPGMHARDHRVLGNFIFQVINKNPLKVYGDGEQTRTFCYIADAMNGFLRVLLLGHSGEVYNIGNPYPEISMNELASITHKALGQEENIIKVPYPDSYPSDEPRRRCPDITKAEKHLEYSPKISLEEGIGKMYRWGVEEER
jgi:UDP-glucuronate decarboxylase